MLKKIKHIKKNKFTKVFYRVTHFVFFSIKLIQQVSLKELAYNK